MKLLTLVLVALIALLQYPLWLGEGGWLAVWDTHHKISLQRQQNEALKARNEALEAEVRDLKQGTAAIEERARSELGMIRQDEVFYQVVTAEQLGTAEPKVQPDKAASNSAKKSLH